MVVRQYWPCSVSCKVTADSVIAVVVCWVEGMRQGEVRAWTEVQRRRVDDIAVEVVPSLLLIPTLSVEMRRLPATPRGATRRGGPIRNETPRQITAPQSRPYPIATGNKGY